MVRPKTFRRKLYGCWRNIQQRCHDPDAAYYADYGGRGIAVCDQWRASFDTFVSDVGIPPTAAHSLDRIDNDGDYKLGNVRWATMKEQARNRSNSIHVTHDGQTMPLIDWAEHFNLKYPTVWQRYLAGRRGADLFVQPNRGKRLT